MFVNISFIDGYVQNMLTLLLFASLYYTIINMSHDMWDFDKCLSLENPNDVRSVA